MRPSASGSSRGTFSPFPWRPPPGLEGEPQRRCRLRHVDLVRHKIVALLGEVAEQVVERPHETEMLER